MRECVADALLAYPASESPISSRQLWNSVRRRSNVASSTSNALRQIVEHTERIAQHVEIEAEILRCCERLERAPGEVVAQRMHVDEVPRRRSAEQGEELVAGQVVEGPHPADGHCDSRVRGWIEADVDLGGLSRGRVGDRHLGESVIGLVDVDLEAFAEQAIADRRPEPIDSGASWTEAVEVTCGAIYNLVSN